MKTFEDDFYFFYNLLKNGTKFSFSKYADGEYAMLVNQRIATQDNWAFNPDTDFKSREELLDSFRFNENGYYVGISCPCCQPMAHVQWMRDNVGVYKDHLTWANIFVNGNYKKFVENFIPEFNNHEIILVGTEKGDPSTLPFKVEKYIPIGTAAFRDNLNLVTELPQENYQNKLFLFCAGPLGNMLAAKMWKHNKNNIYMDIGSTLNPWLAVHDGKYVSGANRGYLFDNIPTSKKICIW